MENSYAFTYGDVEPNIIIPDGFVEGSNRCMNVKATTVCFSDRLYLIEGFE